MARGTGENSGCSKILLVIINGLFMVLGLGILALGIYLKVDPSYSAINNLFKINVQNDAEKSGAYLLNLEAASIVIIIIGAVIAGISIIGILGACFELKPLIIIYGIIITLLLLGLIAIGIAALVFKYALKKNFEDEFKKTLLNEIKNQYEGSLVPKPNAFTVAADVFQVYFECCGINGYIDYNETKIWNRTVTTTTGTTATLKAPVACCKFPAKDRDSVLKGQFPDLKGDYTCGINPTTENSNFDKGCLTPMNQYLDRILLAILITTIVIGLILIIGSVASCCMCRSM